MTRPRIRFYLAVLLFCAPSYLFAQPVVVRPQAGAGNWTVSYTRLFEKGDAQTGTELSGIIKTLSVAKQDAVRLQRWSSSMDSNSEWRLKTIYVEGEDAKAGPPKDATPKSPSLFDAVQKKMEGDKGVQDSLRDLGVGQTGTGKFAADLLTNPAETITKEVVQIGLRRAISVAEGETKAKLEQQAAELLAQPNTKFTEVKVKFLDYLKNVKDTWKHGKDAKEELMGLTGTLAEKQFKEVNGLVATFNREAANAPTGFEGVSRMFPKMIPVGPETMKKVDEWKEALKQQFALEQRKEDLDRRKANLDRVRDDLAKEWKAQTANGNDPDPADPKVIRLREQLKEYQEQTSAYRKDATDYRASAERLKETAARFNPSVQPLDAPKWIPAVELAGTEWRDGRFSIKFQHGNKLEIGDGYATYYEGTYSQKDEDVEFTTAVRIDSRFTIRGKLVLKGGNQLVGEMTDSCPGNVTPGQLRNQPVDSKQTYNMTFKKQ